MKRQEDDIDLRITGTAHHCPAGEAAGKRSMEQAKIPVLSCEGACIRGEIARQAANMIAKEAPYARGCHGELLTVPGSAIARWIRASGKVVLIDGCFLRCHGRVLERLLDERSLIQFDALRVYKKYSDIFDADDVPEDERLATARQVADHVLECLNRGEETLEERAEKSSCCGT